ncbi:GNAT family N-acetyltransferase [Gilvimarinus sp. F26214L]|uniref:GNAT family N-acetyltransferase n=1 Tax=Gilvimarinus sp. DZF01 TaxID=3461371 RepID=UPI00404646ED
MQPSRKVEFVPAVTEVPRETWNGLWATDYPFLNHAFLAALESAGCVGADTPWQGHHALLKEGSDVVGIMPLYKKLDSFGEYVFDWAWADAYHRHGFPYYPKLVTAIPFTPATGPRLCLAGEVDLAAATQTFVSAITEEGRSIGASSWHCLFPEEELCTRLEGAGASRRMGCQFHWLNEGYRDFEDFLSTFSSRKRKNLKRERRRVAEQGLELEVKNGRDITAGEWREFYLFYHLTYFKRSGRHGYLNEGFFLTLAETMPEQIVMVIAREGQEMVAASLFFQGGDTLYGRYWGCSREYEFLHFEACYYQGIDYAIRNGFKRFDPGAQGEHKIQRGFTPVATWSNHWIAHPQFRAAIEDFLERERPGIEMYMAEARSVLPFKSGETQDKGRK